MKTCSECRQEKPEAEYRKHSTGHTMRYCNACHLAKRRAQHAEKREERNAQFRARYAANANGLRDKYAAVRKAKLQRPGESSAEASERWRREQAKLSEGHCLDLVRRLSAENAVRRTTSMAELRAVLRHYDSGGCDDVSYACRRLLKRIDRQ